MRNHSGTLSGAMALVVIVTLIMTIALAATHGSSSWLLAAVGTGQVVVLLGLAWIWSTSRAQPQPANTNSSSAAERTRRHQLLAQLRDVRDAVDALPDAVVLLDERGCVRWFNTAATQLLGVGPGDAGHALADQVAGTELGTWLRSDTRQPSADMSAPVDAPLRLGTTLMPFGATYQLLLARDISTLSRLEQVRRDFVANVSHELRTPLTVIHGYLELLDPSEMPDLAPVLGEMRVQSHRMAQIVEDLLTLSRLETRDTLPDETVNMLSMLEMLRREAVALSRGRHTIEVNAQSEVRLRGSLKDLHSAFSNLVSNAVRYTPSGGEIVIGWRLAADGGGVFSVRDSGLGISSEHLSRLTERFYRVSSSRSRESGGTGLGLSIVKHVLSLHQGRLRVESTPGQGSTFSCVLDSTRLLSATHGDDEWDDAPGA
jgi:two-component system phosphate regulon sensor histidine kinase PhoR